MQIEDVIIGRPDLGIPAAKLRKVADMARRRRDKETVRTVEGTSQPTRRASDTAGGWSAWQAHRSRGDWNRPAH